MRPAVPNLLLAETHERPRKRSEDSMGKKPESELHLQARQILLDARDLVLRGWSCEAAARDGEGRAVDPLHPSARSWSLAGAVEAASARHIDGQNDAKKKRARAIATAALATAMDGVASQSDALRDLDRTIREAAVVGGGRVQEPELKKGDRRPPSNARGADRPNLVARCGVCTREVAGEGLHLQTAGRTLGSFCSQPCLAAAVALATLQRWAAELDGRGRGDEAQAREALGDQLLLLWRRRVGPDPKIVAGAVQLARERDAVDWRRRRG
jgi:hypothetical protein